MNSHPNIGSSIREQLVWASCLIKIPNLLIIFSCKGKNDSKVHSIFKRCIERKRNVVSSKDYSCSFSLLLDPEKSRDTKLGDLKRSKTHQ